MDDTTGFPIEEANQQNGEIDTLSVQKTEEESSSGKPDSKPSELPPAVRARIERNRQRAILLRASRVSNRFQPYTNRSEKIISTSSGSTNVIDTGAGFFLDAEEEELAQICVDDLIEEPAPLLGPSHLLCEECCKEFLESYLSKHFDYPVCDKCRDQDGQHSLITKTDAKQEFCLRDYDFDGREPPLKFILRKNPHNPRWGEMKLFLRLQVHKRALEIWESDEKIEEQKMIKSDNKEKSKQKKYDKKIKELRRAVRTSTWTRDLSKHEHIFGEEELIDEDNDMYQKKCTTCDHVITYEKM